ncbi:uncharacterized protein HMPREF1541_04296 [Cyphellophora europaea CBS 101466]|uniref:Extradiol ring-cleavage dioxygenase class III enzyme subunit B domain-containing protein n=1 Tax=Cyphellophora europaea (strain CBS 101466) TaxID=1220924 RepID=W2RU42_CYPE1|nr:uncharacterized protein HMPREF1541_04296 [Cyphellophora europaea CBS 101466]ETN40021.1 hypothetical protein HMPREF1541_04296 [Cyphellophora europaea CBS 101466]
MASHSTAATTTTNDTTPPLTKRTPVYFVSHGGPTTMYDRQHPVFPKLQSLGQEIMQKVRPKAIVVISAHWQSMVPGAVQVNGAEHEPLLYDFYGFPRHYYAEKFPHVGSRSLAERVVRVLGEGGVRAVLTERGLDHGVFVPFKIMFDKEVESELTVPVVQVSLRPQEEEGDAESHLKMGRALEKLRGEGVLVVVSGMAVHNLRDFRGGAGRGVGGFAYAESFDMALKEAVERQPGEERDREMKALLQRRDARQAHPTFEHLLPIHVGVGAAGSDQGRMLWTKVEGSMSWGQYRFGEVEA